MTAAEPEPVLCLDCERPVTNPRSRARRIGAKCWRERRRKVRAAIAAAAAAVLPGMAGRDSQVEAFIPRKGNRVRSRRIAETVVRDWLGPDVLDDELGGATR